VKLCWPATKEKSGPRPITAHKLREEKNQTWWKGEPDKKWLKKTCALWWWSFSLHLLGHRGRAGWQLPRRHGETRRRRGRMSRV
jgi:hypothetical protein